MFQFKSFFGKGIIDELKNDFSISGTLQSIDQYWNISSLVSGAWLQLGIRNVQKRLKNLLNHDNKAPF